MPIFHIIPYYIYPKTWRFPSRSEAWSALSCRPTPMPCAPRRSCRSSTPSPTRTAAAVAGAGGQRLRKAREKPWIFSHGSSTSDGNSWIFCKANMQIFKRYQKIAMFFPCFSNACDLWIHMDWNDLTQVIFSCFIWDDRTDEMSIFLFFGASTNQHITDVIMNYKWW